MRLRSLLVLLLAVSACPRSEPSSVDAGVNGNDGGDAGERADSGALADDGGTASSTLEPTVVATFLDGGTGTISLNGEIEPPMALTVSLPVRLQDFRIRVLDYRDQVVASDDEFSPDERLYRISLMQPLKTGRAYTMLLDAELGPVVTDDSGRTWNDWELSFRISGEIQADEPSKPAAKKTKKRGLKGPR